MKKATLILLLLLLIFPAEKIRGASPVSGRILLQVEESGQAWYVHPKNQKRHFLGRPADAFRIMRELSLGARHQFITNTDIFPERLAGKILLDVEEHGEAYYIHPPTLKKHYLGRPADAFRVMRELGLGISNKDLAAIPRGDTDKPEDESGSKILISGVPFTPQAPFGNWQDQRQQDGCEEASALMSVRWARGQNLTRQQALGEIKTISDFLQNKYGEYRDISLLNMRNWIFQDYLDHSRVRVEPDVAIRDIIRELGDGNLVLAPMNGQKLTNPYYTPPGPSRHMIIIRGYDPANKIFITNDPGTRHGELFEYNAQSFYEAIRAYPTGYHEPIPEVSRDVIIVEK
ncbi:MAG TPA: C39 family peptidase [Patescibacteria group bacterium]|nr:C39 family peptidase [Patescibacteria group bacterium]